MEQKELSNLQKINSVVEDTKKEIKENRNGVPSYITRFPKINKQLGGGFPRSGVYINISGKSGSFKSRMMVKLMEDFQNRALNPFPVYHLHFNLEMNAKDETIRFIENKVGMNYAKIFSLDRDNKLTEEEEERISKELDKLKSMNIWFVKTGGSVEEIRYTAEQFISKVGDKGNVIISLDHYLLPDALPGQSEIEVVTAISGLFRKLRSEYEEVVNTILITQLNDKIEDEHRIKSPGQHFPRKADIYGSKSVYRDTDYCFVIHRPETLGINKYGPYHLDTDSRIFFHFLKGRHVIDGSFIDYKIDDLL